MKRALASVALATLALAGCAPPGTYSRVRDTIRSLAVQELGPADRYDVSTSHDSPSRLLHGRIARVEVHGINVRPSAGLVLDDLLITARNVQVDRKNQAVEGADETSAKAVISEASLTEMVAHDGSIQQPAVRITADHIQIAGRYKAFGALPVNIVATGKANIVGTAGVQFTAQSVSAGGIPVPIPITHTFEFSRISPALILTGIAMEEGKAVISGTVDWSKLKHG